MNIRDITNDPIGQSGAGQAGSADAARLSNDTAEAQRRRGAEQKPDAQATDAASLSPEAVDKQRSAKLDLVRERLDNGFYNQESVLSQVAKSMIKDLNL